jgi:hypothetical protein
MLACFQRFLYTAFIVLVASLAQSLDREVEECTNPGSQTRVPDISAHSISVTRWARGSVG